jgi:uncharacterized protein (TIGR02466 family)
MTIKNDEFLVRIFDVPLLIGRSDDKKILNKAEKLALDFVEKSSNIRLISDEWNFGVRSSEKSDFDKNGVTTYDSLNLLTAPEWADVVSYIEDFYSTMLLSVYDGPVPHYIMSMWASIYPPGAYIPQHTHGNAQLSGVFYVKTPKNCGNLIFQDVSWVAKTMVYRPNCFPPHNTNFTVGVEEGMMVLFPSWLPHSTLKNESDENRIIISFNVDFGIDPRFM